MGSPDTPGPEGPGRSWSGRGLMGSWGSHGDLVTQLRIAQGWVTSARWAMHITQKISQDWLILPQNRSLGFEYAVQFVRMS